MQCPWLFVQVKDAIQMYEGIIGTTFKFIHCWYILRNEMKWNEWLASMSASNEDPHVQPAEENLDPTLPPRIARQLQGQGQEGTQQHRFLIFSLP